MKQQSKAEEALHRQLRWIDIQIEARIAQQKGLDEQINTLRSIHAYIMREIGELRAARVRASERNKLKPGV